MMLKQLERNLLSSVSEYIVEAGELIRSSLQKEKNYKYKLNKSDLVTDIDHQVESFLIEQLGTVHPGIRFLTEETNPNQAVLASEEMTWVIDPIDGTMNFVHGLERISISVALCIGDAPVAAWIYDIHHGLLYHSQKGGGAFLNGRRLHVSSTNKLENGLIAMGFSAGQWNKNNDITPLIQRFAGNSRGIRITGSSCLDFADVAAGRLDGFWHFGLQPWDVAAGMLLVTEAGGKVTAVAEDETVLQGKGIIASNGRLHREVRNKVR